MGKGEWTGSTKHQVPEIVRDASEKDLAQRSIELLREYGIIETWYHDVPAFIFLGSRSCLSVSEKDYPGGAIDQQR